MMKTDLPLHGVRVVEMLSGKCEMCTRYLADLGADVILLEPLQGAASRCQPPYANDGQSLYAATHHANKRSIALDFSNESDRKKCQGVFLAADIIVHSDREQTFLNGDLSVDTLRQLKPELVVISITDFGCSGPYADYQGSNAVHLALAGVLARSGIKNKSPLLPPGNLAYETAAIQAAWAVCVAYWQRLQTGQGDALDFSVFEATAQILDPALGVTGSAAAGKSAKELAPRGRPPIGKGYPIFPCADGFVRICVLNPRQWQGMSEWLGDDHPFTDPSYGKIGKRFKVIKEINALIAKLFSDKDKHTLVAEGQRRGVPIAAVATPADVLNDEHFKARNAFAEIEIGSRQGLMPSGFVEVDAVRMGVRNPAPKIGENTQAILSECASGSSTVAEEKNTEAIKPDVKKGPLAGLRVLDLGVIVAGAELGRLFADQGAEVIKVENSVYPDGLRQSQTGDPMTESFAQGSRGKKSFGLNLRSEGGMSLFKKLVAVSDVILSNFKPGTMESLGLDIDSLKAINPEILVADSSALGATGPLSRSMGYGPLVRASTGLTGLWSYPEEAGSYSDSITIFPDHFAARVSAVALLSLLIRRRRTGEGGSVSVSQAETILMALSDGLLEESLSSGALRASGNHSRFYVPFGVFPCAGDDEWCVISVETDQQWLALCEQIDRKDLAADTALQDVAVRLERCQELDEIISQWTQQHTSEAVMADLQQAGVPAAKMQRIVDLEEDVHLKARDFFTLLNQPGLPGPLLTEKGLAKAEQLGASLINPAPFLGQHTRLLCSDILGLSDAAIDELIAEGSIEVLDDELAAIATS